jgi:hypothetical protein
MPLLSAVSPLPAPSIFEAASAEQATRSVGHNETHKEKETNTLILNNASNIMGECGPGLNAATPPADHKQEKASQQDVSLASSASAEQNAEEAADYWSLL